MSRLHQVSSPTVNVKSLDFNRLESNQPVSDTHIMTAIVHVIENARSNGQTLDEVIAELMVDDALLDHESRHLLGDIVSQAWAAL